MFNLHPCPFLLLLIKHRNKLWLAIAITPENALLISQRHGSILVVDMSKDQPVFRQEIRTDATPGDVIFYNFHTLAVDPIGGYLLALDADGKRLVKYGYKGCLMSSGPGCSGGDSVRRKPKRPSSSPQPPPQPPSPNTSARMASTCTRPTAGMRSDGAGNNSSDLAFVEDQF